MVKYLLNVAAAILWGGGGGKKPKKQKAQKPPQESTNPFVRYKFNCRLCDGETFFDALPHMHDSKIYELECKWCGIENRVEVRATIHQT